MGIFQTIRNALTSILTFCQFVKVVQLVLSQILYPMYHCMRQRQCFKNRRIAIEWRFSLEHEFL